MTTAARTPCGAVIWFTGLSGAGKSTLAAGTRALLAFEHLDGVLIDGDLLRQGVCRDLGYSEADRRENIRRAGELALSHALAGQVAVVALISPFDDARQTVRRRCSEANVPFSLVYVNAPIACCEERDPKGLYRRARAGAVANFTGIQSPYEPPTDAELEVHTDRESVAESVRRVGEMALRLVGARPVNERSGATV